MRRPASASTRRRPHNRRRRRLATSCRRDSRLRRRSGQLGYVSVAAVLKRMEDTLGPASIPVRGELEDRAAAGAVDAPATSERRAVEVSSCVEDQAADRACLRRRALNEWSTLSVQLPSPFGVSSKTVPTSEGAAIVRRAVEISGCVEDQAGQAATLRRCRPKRMEDALGPASISVRGQLENRAAAVGIPARIPRRQSRRAVEITGRVEDQASKG